MFIPSKQTMLKPPALVSVTNANATTAINIITVYSATAIAAELKKAAQGALGSDILQN